MSRSRGLGSPCAGTRTALWNVVRRSFGALGTSAARMSQQRGNEK
jgi:hypothetical protein